MDESWRHGSQSGFILVRIARSAKTAKTAKIETREVLSDWLSANYQLLNRKHHGAGEEPGRGGR
jgi:hypothetical protein